MKCALTLAAIVAVVAAQGISDIPACSLSCFTSALPSTGCGLTDFKCSCAKADQLTPALVPCVQKACPSAADQSKVLEVLGAICAAAGVPINPPAPAPAPSTPAAPKPEQPSAKPEEPKPSSAPSAAPKPPVVSSAGYPSPAPSKPAGETCVESTVTVTVTRPVATAPPYPSGPAKPSTPVGTGVPTVPTSTKPAVPEFTGAAAAVQMPVALAGVVGLAALFL